MKKGGWDIPDYGLEAIIKCFLPDIQEFFATDEGEEYREEYKSGKEPKAKPKAQIKTRQGVFMLLAFNIANYDKIC